MEDKINLAKRLLEISKTGSEGEARNAEQHFKRVCEKYGIDPNSLSDDHITDREFKYKNKFHSKFVRQVIASVCGGIDFYEYRIGGKKEPSVVVKITDFQFVECSERIEFYWDLYNKELELFYSAFVQKNRLFKKGGVYTDTGDPAELEKRLRILQMAEGIKSDTPTKKLKG